MKTTSTMYVTGYGKTKRGAVVIAIETLVNEDGHVVTWAYKLDKNQAYHLVKNVSWFVFDWKITLDSPKVIWEYTDKVNEGRGHTVTS